MPLHAERRGHGPPLVLVHGFTQTGRCWGPEADALAVDHELIRVDAPGPRRSGASVGRTWPTAPRLHRATQGGAATYLGYSMGARFVPARGPRPTRSSSAGSCCSAAPPGIEDPTRAGGPAGPGPPAPPRGCEDEGLEPFLDDWLAPAAVRRAAARAGRSGASGCENTVDGPGGEPRAGRHRLAGPRRGTSSATSRCRCSCWPAPTTTSSPRWPSAWPAEIGANATAGARRRRRSRRPPRAARTRFLAARPARGSPDHGL